MIYTGINWTDQEPDFWNDFTGVLVPYPTPPWIEWAKTGEMDEKKRYSGRSSSENGGAWQTQHGALAAGSSNPGTVQRKELVQVQQ